MLRVITIDDSLISRFDKYWRDKIIEVSHEHNIELYFSPISESLEVHQREIVTIIGVACSVGALIVSILGLLKKPKEAWSYNKILAECHAFLKLNGINEYYFEYVYGINNLIEMNGIPCVIKVLAKNGDPILLHIGLTADMLVISPAEYDQHMLLP